MPPHAHGAEEEEVIIVRTDGPPFYDIKAKPGKGFDQDYERLAKYLGPGKISLADFMRDIEAINKSYVPTALASYKWLQYGTIGLLGSFVAFIIMGIVGEDFGVTADVRSFVIPLIFLVFLFGVLCSAYSKWIEQPGIREGAVLVKKAVDELVNPRYMDSQFRIRWTVRVNVQKKSSIHMGQTFVERPVLTIWALRSSDENGVMTDWVLPSALSNGGIATTTDEGKSKTSPKAGAGVTPAKKRKTVRTVGTGGKKKALASQS